MPQLSNELFIQIFDYLDRTALKSCLAVCRNWNTLIGPIYYHEIYVLENEMNVFLLFIQDSRLVEWIKKLVICKAYTAPKYVSTSGYQLLLSCLPYLEKIYIHQSVNSVWHLEHLLAVDTAVLKNMKEIKLLNNTRLHYNENNRYLDERMAHWYTLNTVKLCRTITHLEMNNLSIGSFSYEGFMEYLNCFENLTHLKIENLLSSGIQRLSPINILSQCPKLKEFDFLSEYHQQDTATTELPLTVNHHLVSVKLKLPALPVSFITYLVHYLPTHIHQLTIITTHSILPNWIDSFDDLISTMNNVTLEMKGTVFWLPGYSNSSPCISQFWNTLNKVKGSRNLDIHMNISLDHFTPSPECSIRLENNKTLQVMMTHTDPYTFTSRTDIDLVSFLGLTEPRLKSFILRERGPSCIHPQQLVPLLDHLLTTNTSYVSISSESLSQVILDYNSFMPSQATSIRLNSSDKYGVLENVYITQELVDVLSQLELDSLNLWQCQYQQNIYLKSSHLKEFVIRGEADQPSVVIRSKNITKRYQGKSDAVVMTVECASLDCFRLHR